MSTQSMQRTSWTYIFTSKGGLRSRGFRASVAPTPRRLRAGRVACVRGWWVGIYALKNVPFGNSFIKLNRGSHRRNIRQSKRGMEHGNIRLVARVTPRRHPLHLLKHLSTSGHNSFILYFFPAAVLTTLVAFSSITPLLKYHPPSSSQPSSLQPDLPNQNSPRPIYRACLECLGNRIMAKNLMKFRCIRYNF